MTIRMYKPLKKIYFWVKSKVYKMINKAILKNLQERRNLIFNTMVNCIHENEINEYVIHDDLITESKNYEKINFRIGDDRFRIYSFMDIGGYKIYFKTYYWKFNPNVVNDYEKSHIEELDILSIDEAVLMRGSKPGHNHIKEELPIIIRIYFNKIKSFIIDFHAIEVGKIEKSIGFK